MGGKERYKDYGVTSRTVSSRGHQELTVLEVFNPRFLQILNDLSSDKSNIVVIGIPLEMLRALEGKTKKK
jgi:hypothetical protein